MAGMPEKTAAPLPTESMENPVVQKTAAPVPEESIPVPVIAYPVYGQPVAAAQQQGGLPQWGRPAGVPVPRISEWKYGMCCPCCIPCADCGLCCDTFWCSCCQLSRQWAAIKDGRSDDPNWNVCCTICCLGLFISFCTGAGGGIVTWVVGWHLRNELRENATIEGNVFGDCCATFCCLCCTMIQQHRELKARGVDPGYTCCSSSLSRTVQQGYPVESCGGRKDEPSNRIVV